MRRILKESKRWHLGSDSDPSLALCGKRVSDPQLFNFDERHARSVGIKVCKNCRKVAKGKGKSD
jgi:hypothetical protein